MSRITARPAALVALAAASTLALAAPALAQDARNLDRSDNDMRAFTDSFPADGEARSFTFTVPANQELVIQVLPRGDADSFMTLYDDATDEEIASDDDGGYNLDSRIELRTQKRMRYRLEVSEFEGATGGEMFDIILRTAPYVPPRLNALALGSTQDVTMVAGQPSLYRFDGREGQLVELRMRSEDLDSMLMLHRGVGTDGELVAENDDSGEGLDSMIRLRLPATGTYTVRASDFDERAGAFTLALREIEAIESGGPIGLGEEAAGDLALLVQTGGDQASYAEYTLTAQAVETLASGGGWLVVDMMSEDMDSSLLAGFDTPLGFAGAVDDDDGGSGLDARLFIDLAGVEAGWLQALRLRAQSAVGDAGPYTMLLRHDADGTLKAALEAEAEMEAEVSEGDMMEAAAMEAADELEAEADAMEAEDAMEDQPVSVVVSEGVRRDPADGE